MSYDCHNEAAQAINKELSKKQKEFGLTVGT